MMQREGPLPLPQELYVLTNRVPSYTAFVFYFNHHPESRLSFPALAVDHFQSTEAPGTTHYEAVVYERPNSGGASLVL